VGAAEKTGGAHSARRGLRSEGEQRAHAQPPQRQFACTSLPFKRRAPVNRMLRGVNQDKALTASLLPCTAAGGACSERESELLRDSLSLQATGPAGISYKEAFRRAFNLNTQGSTQLISRAPPLHIKPAPMAPTANSQNLKNTTAVRIITFTASATTKIPMTAYTGAI